MTFYIAYNHVVSMYFMMWFLCQRYKFFYWLAYYLICTSQKQEEGSREVKKNIAERKNLEIVACKQLIPHLDVMQ